MTIPTVDWMEWFAVYEIMNVEQRLAPCFGALHMYAVGLSARFYSAVENQTQS